MTILILDNVGILRAVCNVRRVNSPRRLNSIVCAPTIVLQNCSYYQLKLIELKGERYKSTIIFEDFNTRLLIVGKIK